ncbi:7811_t:CDS:2 [Ambispora gerdemannii]|uniref:7811_t:CDS:1 n=1 Tax=Ambispora gerdemannii TaxID=144530 RepID=A0A9N8VYP3_9GLOM|nr:7811_t:CDS:2 [Ambispora gerdemannii]
MEMPYWMAYPYAINEYVGLEMPERYNKRVRNALRAGPMSVNLRELCPYFYLFGFKMMADLDLSTSINEEIYQRLVDSYKDRTREIINHAFSTDSKEESEIENKFDETEKQLYKSLREQALRWKKSVENDSSIEPQLNEEADWENMDIEDGESEDNTEVSRFDIKALFMLIMKLVQRTLALAQEFHITLARSTRTRRYQRYQPYSTCSLQKFSEKNIYTTITITNNSFISPAKKFLTDKKSIAWNFIISRHLNIDAHQQNGPSLPLSESTKVETVSGIKEFRRILSQCSRLATKGFYLNPNLLTHMWNLYVALEFSEKSLIELNEFDEILRVLNHNGHKYQPKWGHLIIVLEDMKNLKLEYKLDHYHMLIIALGKQKDLTNAVKAFLDLQARGMIPNGATFNHLIDAYLTNHDYTGAIEVYKRLKYSNFPKDIPTSFFNKIIKLQCSRGYWKNALDIYKDMHTFNIPPTIRTLNIILHATCEHKGYETGLQVLHEKFPQSIRKDITAYNILLSAAVRDDNFDGIMGIWQEMRAAEIKPNTVTFTIMMQCHIKHERLEEAYIVYREIVSCKLRPDFDTFRTLIEASLFDEYSFGKIGYLIKEMRHYGLDIDPSLCYSITLNVIEKNGPAAAEFILEKLLATGLRMDYRSPFAIIKGYVRRQEMTNASLLFRSMQAYGIKPDQDLYEMIIRGFLNRGDEQLARSFYFELAKNTNNNIPEALWPKENSDISIVNEFLELCSKKKLRFGLDLYEHMKTLGFKGDSVTHIILISSFLGGNFDEKNLEKLISIYDYASAANIQFPLDIYNNLLNIFVKKNNHMYMKKVLEDMQRANHEPDTFTLSILLKGSVAFSDVNLFKSLYQKTESISKLNSNLVICNGFIFGFCKFGEMELAAQVFNRLLAMKIEPDRITYNTLIRGYIKENNVDEACRYFYKMIDSGIRPPMTAFHSLIYGYLDSSQPQEAIQIFDQFVENYEQVEFDLPAYQTIYQGVIEASLKTSTPNLAQKLLTKLSKQQNPLNCFSYIILKCIRRDSLECAYYIFQFMLSRRIDVSLFVGQSLLEAFGKKTDFPIVWQIYCYLRHRYFKRSRCRLNLQVYNIVIKCSSVTRHQQFAEQVFSNLLQARLKPTIETLNALISGLVKRRKNEEVQNIIKRMLDHYNIPPNVDTFNMIIKSTVRRGRMEEAYSKLDKMKQLNIKPDIRTFHILLSGFIWKRTWNKAAYAYEQLLNEYSFDPDMRTVSILCGRLITQRYTSLPKLRELYDWFHERGKGVSIKDDKFIPWREKNSYNSNILLSKETILQQYQKPSSYDPIDQEISSSSYDPIDQEIFRLLYRITRNFRVKKVFSSKLRDIRDKELTSSSSTSNNRDISNGSSFNEIVDLFIRKSGKKDLTEKIQLTRTTYLMFLKAFWKHGDMQAVKQVYADMKMRI